MSDDARLVCFVTGPADAAEGLAKALVEQHLVACVNVVPTINSFYIWEGELQNDSECLMVLKTTRDRIADIDAVLRELHPYDVYELVCFEVTDGSAPYLEWIATEVSRGR